MMDFGISLCLHVRLRLAKALEEARHGAVQPKDLEKMQQCFEQLMALQRLQQLLLLGGSHHLGCFLNREPWKNWHNPCMMIRGSDMEFEWKDHWL